MNIIEHMRNIYRVSKNAQYSFMNSADNLNDLLKVDNHGTNITLLFGGFCVKISALLEKLIRIYLSQSKFTLLLGNSQLI